MKPHASIILGIDPGIADTGYGVICRSERNQLSCLLYGSIKTSAKIEVGERLDIIYRELTKIIKKFRPELIAVEKLFFCNNAKTAMIVGQARGVVILAAHQQKIPVSELTPLQIKQAVSSYGAASKLQVQRMVKLILSLKEIPKPDDAADALAVAITCANTNKHEL